MDSLYEKLLEASESLLVGDMLLEGVSDPEELANHAWMMIESGEIKLPEGSDVSFKSIALKVKLILCGGTSTYRKDRNQSDFSKHKYGRLRQAEGLEDYIAGFNYSEPDSDLDEVLPLILGMMSEQGREIIEGIQPFEGNVNAYAEAIGIPQRTAHDRVEKARKEFLSLIPEDCVLYNTSRRLRRRYNIGEASVN